MSKLYILNWDYNYIRDKERDAYHLPFENSDKASTIFSNPKYKSKLPDKIYFKANFNVIKDIDYPLTDINTPIVSHRMLQIIERIGEVKMIKTPVIMVDDTSEKILPIGDKETRDDIDFIDTFYAITLLERQEGYFNSQLSEFDLNELNPLIPGYIKKLVLRVDDKLPPIFRIKEIPSKLFITSLVKKSLEKSEVKGCTFETVDTALNYPNVNSQNINLKENFKNEDTASWNQFYNNFALKAFEMNDEEYLEYLKSIRCPFGFIGKASKIKQVYKDIEHFKNIDNEVKIVASVIASGDLLQKENLSCDDWLKSLKWQDFKKEEKYSIMELASFENGNNHIKSKIMEMPIFKLF